MTRYLYKDTIYLYKDKRRGGMRGKRSKSNKRKAVNSGCSFGLNLDEIISTEECKKYLGKFDLTDQRIIEIKNSLIGLVDGTINSYLDSFV